MYESVGLVLQKIPLLSSRFSILFEIWLLEIFLIDFEIIYEFSSILTIPVVDETQDLGIDIKLYSFLLNFVGILDDDSYYEESFGLSTFHHFGLLLWLSSVSDVFSSFSVINI